MAMMPMDFPKLSIDEVISFCRDLFDVNITEDELRKPTSHFVKKLYLDIATASMQISNEQMLQPHFKFLSAFQHPDIAEEGASFMFFVILLQRFMHAALIKDFNKNDLSNPKPKRTLHCLSALVNFEKFKTSQDSHFYSALEEKETLFGQRAQLLNKNQELKQKIAKLKAAKSGDEEKIQQILPVVDGLERAVIDLNRQQASDMKQTQQLKTDLAEQTSKEAELKVIIANNNEECEKFKAQIVTSPEKFRGELSRMNSAINVCKDAITEKGTKLLEKKTQEESIDLLEENCTQAVRLISSLEDEAEKLRNLQRKLQEKHDVVTTDDEVLVQQNFQYKNVKRQLASQNEKLSRLERTNEKKFSAKNDEFEHRKKNVESLEKNRQQCFAEISQINTEFQEVIKTLNEKEQDHANEMDAMENGYQQMITSINNYHAKLEEGSQRLFSALSGAK